MKFSVPLLLAYFLMLPTSEVCSALEAQAEGAAPLPVNQPVEGRQVILHTRCIAIQSAKLRKLGIELPIFDERDNQGGRRKKHEFASESFERLIRVLRKKGIARVLADPKVAMVEGRESHMAIGGTTRTVGENPREFFFGTRQTATARIVKDDRALIQLEFELSVLAGKDKLGNPIIEGNTFRGLINTKLGQTSVLAKVMKKKGQDEDTLLLAVTPEIIERQ